MVDTTLPMEQNPQPMPKLPFIVGGVIVLMLVLLVIILGKRSSSPAISTNPSPSPLKKKVAVPPEVQFAHYTLTTSLPTVPASLQTYTVKVNLTPDEVKEINARLGTVNVQNSANGFGLYYGETATSKDFTIFDTKSGGFSYTSTSKPDVSSIELSTSTPTQTAEQFIQKIFVGDSTITCPITYKKKNRPTVTYVECHRDWEKMGLPLVSSVGLVNVPELQRLTTLQPGMVYDNTPDTNIYDTSTKQDGLKRPNDFNTVTVQISDKEKRVVAADSNIRFITSSTPINATISPQEALDAFIAKKASFSFVKPIGKGQVGPDKIYPDNKVVAQEATVQDYAIVYLEQPPSTLQTAFEPMYLIRGTAKLVTGYTVQFIQTVPASTKVQSRLLEAEGQVAGTSTSSVSNVNDRGQKQGTFQFFGPTTTPTFTPTPTPCPPGYILNEGSCILIKWGAGTPSSTPKATSTPGVPTEVPTEQPPPPTPDTSDCQDTTCEYCFTEMRSAFGATFGLEKSDTKWYIIPSQSNMSSLQQSLDDLRSQLDSNPSNDIREQMDLIMEYLGAFTNTSGLCPIRVTGPSPSLFVYGTTGMTFHISPQFILTYSNPAISEKNTWQISMPHPYLYYEYAAVHFQKPDSGWVVERKNLEAFSKTISQSLALTNEETERLGIELTNALSYSKDTNLFIGLIPQAEVDEKLPLIMSPQPEKVYRYHFFITPHIPATGSTPRLDPIKRGKSTLVELGAVYEK